MTWLSYLHILSTLPRCAFVLPLNNKSNEIKKKRTVGAIPKSNQNLVRNRCKIDRSKNYTRPLTFLACYRHFNKKQNTLCG